MTDEHSAWLGVPKSDGLKAADRASQIGKEEGIFRFCVAQRFQRCDTVATSERL